MADEPENPLDPGVTRRDFVGTTLVGTGAALLTASCARPSAPAAASDPWTGDGGVGDYADANGNTARVVAAGHRIRDGRYDGALPDVIDTRETYDLVVVGGGFTGMGALHEFRARRPDGRCLVLDNQAVFGGYAKANGFDVGGARVTGAQASMNFIVPHTPEERANSYWDSLGLPEAFRFAERADGRRDVRYPKGTSSTLYHGEQCGTSGYFFGSGGWRTDIWRDDLARAALPETYRAGLLKLRERKRTATYDEAEARRLDRITFADFATRELGVAPEVLPYITQGMCITGAQVSALAAKSLPGLDRFAEGSADAAFADRFVGFPGGNAAILRHFVKAHWPGAIGGTRAVADVADAPLNLAALDRTGAPSRMRLGATVARVTHDGDPRTAAGVFVTYEKGGRLYRVTAKAAVMAIGAWVAKHIVPELPDEHRAALDRFHYAPILIANVALRDWRFLDRLGIATARWFDGFGFYASIRRPMLGVGAPAPFDPAKPIVMTFYVPIQHPDLPLEAQGGAARQELFATSYAAYERRLIDQMTRMFGSAGFDARRDVAGVVLNRWGHAFVMPGPGFHHGTDDAHAPIAVARQRVGRIAFGQSGLEEWSGAARAGRRAVGDILPLL